jgi:glycosyltransferase involved in cell wall biosynthesis
MKPYRIIHFVSGGGSGSTAMVVSLAAGNQQGPHFEPMIVFRNKKKYNPELYHQIETKQIKFREVCQAPKLQTIRQLCAIIKQFQPQVLVAHGFGEHIWGRIAAILCKVPIIIQVEHNNEKYSFVRLWLSKHLLRFTNKLVCVSQGVRKHLEKLGFELEKITVVYNGIPVEEFLPLQNSPYDERADHILMVARFARQKDHASLIKAAKILHEINRPIRISFIGSGKRRYKEQNIALCHQLKLDETIFFLNRKTRPEIRELLSKNKIFVLSTHHEGLPLALIEAMAAGCVVIASNVDGVSELIEHGKTGFLVPPEDPVALAEAITYVLENEELASAAAKAGQVKALQHFNLETMVNQYEQLFLAEIANKMG